MINPTGITGGFFSARNALKRTSKGRERSIVNDAGSGIARFRKDDFIKELWS